MSLFLFIQIVYGKLNFTLSMKPADVAFHMIIRLERRIRILEVRFEP